MNFAVSYSGGKDSALALYKMVKKGHNPVALITTVNVDQNRSWFHGVQSELMSAVSESLRIPLIICECTSDGYTKAYEAGLEKARLAGADCCVFGDIDIEGHREWNEERCRKAGLSCLLPLWRQNRERLTLEGIGAGLKSMIKIVDVTKLDDSFLGRTLTAGLVEKIKATGIDVCGENGEYHTFVYDGPMFASPVAFETGEIVDFGTHKAIDMKLIPGT